MIQDNLGSTLAAEDFRFAIKPLSFGEDRLAIAGHGTYLLTYHPEQDVYEVRYSTFGGPHEIVCVSPSQTVCEEAVNRHHQEILSHDLEERPLG